MSIGTASFFSVEGLDGWQEGQLNMAETGKMSSLTFIRSYSICYSWKDGWLCKSKCAVVVPYQVIWDILPITKFIYLSIQPAYSYPRGILVNLIVVLLRLPVMIQNLEWCSEAYQVLGAGSSC